ncbi:MAG: hypothetical protein D6813_08045 [Calditrichaeota bacterium]|nr:MAG: hypothetical protein D6813_08045 [Calditrichota bacterium]
MNKKNKQLKKRDSFYEQSPEPGTLTGTALVTVAIFFQQEYSMTSMGSTFTLDSNDETTRQILDRHMSKFSKAWKTLADK